MERSQLSQKWRNRYTPQKEIFGRAENFLFPVYIWNGNNALSPDISLSTNFPPSIELYNAVWCTLEALRDLEKVIVVTLVASSPYSDHPLRISNTRLSSTSYCNIWELIIIINYWHRQNQALRFWEPRSTFAEHFHKTLSNPQWTPIVSEPGCLRNWNKTKCFFISCLLL